MQKRMLFLYWFLHADALLKVLFSTEALFLGSSGSFRITSSVPFFTSISWKQTKQTRPGTLLLSLRPWAQFHKTREVMWFYWILKSTFCVSYLIQCLLWVYHMWPLLCWRVFFTFFSGLNLDKFLFCPEVHVCWITFIDVWILNQTYILMMKPTWSGCSWCMIVLMHSYI